MCDRQREREGGEKREWQFLFGRGLQNKHLQVSHNYYQQKVGVVCTKLVVKLTCEWGVRDEHVASDDVISECVSVTCDECVSVICDECGEWGQEEGHSFQCHQRLVVVADTEISEIKQLTDTRQILEKTLLSYISRVTLKLGQTSFFWLALP